jgi:hypothetical protein
MARLRPLLPRLLLRRWRWPRQLWAASSQQPLSGVGTRLLVARGLPEFSHDLRSCASTDVDQLGALASPPPQRRRTRQACLDRHPGQRPIRP